MGSFRGVQKQCTSVHSLLLSRQKRGEKQKSAKEAWKQPIFAKTLVKNMFILLLFIQNDLLFRKWTFNIDNYFEKIKILVKRIYCALVGWFRGDWKWCTSVYSPFFPPKMGENMLFHWMKVKGRPKTMY